MRSSTIKCGLSPLPILAVSLLAIVVVNGVNLPGFTQIRPREIRGTRTIGLIGELLLASPIAVDALPAPPVPPPLLSLEDIAAEGAWLPTWLPADVEAGPVATTLTTAAGDRIIRLEFQVLRGGERRPVMIVQVDGPSESGLVYAPAPPAWLDQLNYGIASVARKKLKLGVEEGKGPTPAPEREGDDIRQASYESTTINNHPAKAIIVPSDRGMLYGVLWQVKGTWLYVGGYLPMEEIRAVAEGLEYRSK